MCLVYHLLLSIHQRKASVNRLCVSFTYLSTYRYRIHLERWYAAYYHCNLTLQAAILPVFSPILPPSPITADNLLYNWRQQNHKKNNQKYKKKKSGWDKKQAWRGSRRSEIKAAGLFSLEDTYSVYRHTVWIAAADTVSLNLLICISEFTVDCKKLENKADSNQCDRITT